MDKEIPCPYCEDEVVVEDNDKTVKCLTCGLVYHVKREKENIELIER